MQNVNASIQVAADQALAKAQETHQITSVVLDYCSGKGVAVESLYAAGYCADALVTVNLPGQLVSLETLLKDVFPPLPTAHVSSKGSSTTIKPCSYLRDHEKKNENVVPVFPVYQKVSGRESSLRWWTKVSSGHVVEVVLPHSDELSSQYGQVLHGRNVEADSTSFVSGSTHYFKCGFTPLAEPRKLPILALDKAWDVSDDYVRNLLKRHTSVLLNQAWNWRNVGLEATQKQLEQLYASLDFEHGMLTTEQNTESKVYHEQLVKDYLRLCQETDVMLNECKDVLIELFTTVGVPEASPAGVSCLKRFLAEKLNIEVPLLEISRNRDKVRCLLATQSRALYAPVEFVCDIDADKVSLRFQDIGLTYDMAAIAF